MPIYSKQSLGYSVKLTSHQPTTDGGQSTLPAGFKNVLIFWAWLVPEGDLNQVITDALPPTYALDGQPTIAEIENIKHYNVRVTGVSYTDEPMESLVESPNSGQFY